jgi:hypothetical protein
MIDYLKKLRDKLADFWDESRLRKWLLRHFVAFYWWCDWLLEHAPHPKQKSTYLFEPISMSALLTSLIVSGAALGAQLIINSLLAPKPRPVVQGKLTGDIKLTDSVFGYPVYRIYGGRPEDDNQGGVEIGGNIIWLPKIDKIQTTSQQPTGGGKGGGGRRTQTTTQINYKVDIAVAFGTGNGGRLRLLRLKLNEDTVYNITGGGTNPIPLPDRYEAEDPSNTLSGGASVVDDPLCSGGKKVTGIGFGGTLTFNDITVNLPPSEPNEDIPTAHMDVVLRYKSTGDTQAYVKFNGTGGIYTFPDTGGVVGTKYIARNFMPAFDLEISNPLAAGPEIDCVDVEGYWIYTPSEFPNVPTASGVRDPLFPEEPQQDNILIPDPNDFDTNAFERFNGKSDSSSGFLEITLPNGAELTWYEGGANQPIDPVIAAQINAEYGADSCPAFLDIAYCRIRRLDITKYGTVPNFRALVENIDLQTVEEILLAEASLAGLPPEDFDLSVLSERHSRGYLVSNTEAPLKAFEDFALLENVSFVESSDGKIVAKDLTDRTVVAQIPASDLGAYVLDEQETPPETDVVVTIEDETELAREYELSYFDPKKNSDYNTDRVSVAFPYTGSRRKETKSVPATLTESEALAVAKRELQRIHRKDTAPVGFTVSHKYSWLDAGDCIEVEIGGEMRRVRIEEKTGSAPGIYEIAATDESLEVFADASGLTSSVTNKGPISDVVRFPANSVGTIIDIPALSVQQEGRPGVYVAACKKGEWGDWEGCGVFREKGGEFGLLATIERQCAIGRAVNAIGDIPSGYKSNIFDPDSTVTVDFYGDFEPQTITSLQASEGLGAYVIGEEVCVVQTWTRDNDYPNRWIGSDIYRVLKNTRDKATTHVPGERVVFLDDAVKFVPLDREDLNKTRTWKFVTVGQDIADAAPIYFQWKGDNIYNKLIYTNEGVSGKTLHVLPEADDGLEYGFEVVEPFDYVVQAGDDDFIRIAETITGAGGKISSSTPGARIYLKAESGVWKMTEMAGTWEVV